ncbi:MAG: ABC transporter permease [Liquorilactobacillus hordei]|uniref:Spermidine putrescine ABC transporter permease n=2 Tax=Liquorilactobacillus hordei TaxID=468911 RepID=A0A0R1MI60_9LACO|nr:ABC transporter permease [Liquorilactobacillus hordei]AUJ30321.1 spermidine/putrescine ABC transporter permease PotC [Liquorilactobacillus hordei]KRL07273.1 spermidine putrescine ABC transporter permease [Liquorilactobacillus hordei DSM 19519]QYH52933.1 ABC transporter permease [Liquorilactobacillus hordei DSM 19519]
MITKKNNFWRNLYLVIAFLILYLPIFYLIFYSFNSGGGMSDFSHFTWRYYREIWADQRLILITVQTFFLAFLSSLLATIIGTSGALGIYSIKNMQVRTLILGLNNILLVSPDVIIGSSFLIFFTVLGIKLGFTSVLLSHIAFSIPIVVLMVLPKLQEMNSSFINVAQDLGANQWQILKGVILPIITPGMIAGYFMAFTYSLDDFAVTFFVTGNGFETLSVEIYSRARQGISLEINALSALMFLFSLVLVIGYYFISKDSPKSKRKDQKAQQNLIR